MIGCERPNNDKLIGEGGYGGTGSPHLRPNRA